MQLELQRWLTPEGKKKSPYVLGLRCLRCAARVQMIMLKICRQETSVPGEYEGDMTWSCTTLYSIVARITAAVLLSYSPIKI